MTARICHGCHQPIATTLPACPACASLMEARAEAWSAMDWWKDRMGTLKARVLVNRRGRRAAASKGNPKGQRRG